jgi:hypothetical protein
MSLYPVAVVLQYTKTQNNTYTRSKKYTTHKITNIMFQPSKERKVEYNTIIQKTRNIQKNKDTKVIKFILYLAKITKSDFVRQKSKSLINNNTK